MRGRAPPATRCSRRGRRGRARAPACRARGGSRRPIRCSFGPAVQPGEPEPGGHTGRLPPPRVRGCRAGPRRDPELHAQALARGLEHRGARAGSERCPRGQRRDLRADPRRRPRPAARASPRTRARATSGRRVREKLLASEILVLATPTWFGQPSSVVKRVLERMDAMLSETDDDGRPVAFNRVAGFVVTGNEDGAHHVIAELAQAVNDIGYTVPGAGLDVLEQGPGPGPDVPRDRRGPRLVGADGAHGRGQPRRRRRGTRRAPAAPAGELTCAAPPVAELSAHAAAAPSTASSTRSATRRSSRCGAISLRRRRRASGRSSRRPTRAAAPRTARPRACCRTRSTTGSIGPGTTVVESTSGNMGVGLAQACRYHGLQLICVVDSRDARDERARRCARWAPTCASSPSRIPRPATCSSRGCAGAASCSPRSPDSFWPDQYANESNPAAHADGHDARDRRGARRRRSTTSSSRRARPGTLRGCGDYLREHGRGDAGRRRRRRRQRPVRRHARTARGCPGFGAGVETELSRSRPTTTSSCASPISTASSAAAGSPSARRSSPAPRRAASRSRSRRSPRSMPPGSRCAADLPRRRRRLPRHRLRRRLGRARARLRRRRGSRRSSRQGRPRSAAATRRSSVRVAIVGLGPKGLFALERLLDHARDCHRARARGRRLRAARRARRRPGLRPATSRPTCA